MHITDGHPETTTFASFGRRQYRTATRPQVGKGRVSGEARAMQDERKIGGGPLAEPNQGIARKRACQGRRSNRSRRMCHVRPQSRCLRTRPPARTPVHTNACETARPQEKAGNATTLRSERLGRAMGASLPPSHKKREKWGGGEGGGHGLCPAVAANRWQQDTGTQADVREKVATESASVSPIVASKSTRLVRGTRGTAKLTEAEKHAPGRSAAARRPGEAKRMDRHLRGTATGTAQMGQCMRRLGTRTREDAGARCLRLRSVPAAARRRRNNVLRRSGGTRLRGATQKSTPNAPREHTRGEQSGRAPGHRWAPGATIRRLPTHSQARSSGLPSVRPPPAGATRRRCLPYAGRRCMAHAVGRWRAQHGGLMQRPLRGHREESLVNTCPYRP